MTDKQFADIVAGTKAVVLAAVAKYLPDEYYFAIDDLTQEIYLRAYGALSRGKFREEAKLTTWIYQIAKNESHRMHRKLIREEEKKIKALNHYKESLKTEKKSLMTIDKIRDLADRLTDDLRSAFLLYIEGKSEREISAELEIPAGTVKSRISRAKMKMRDLYRGGEYEYK